MGDTALASAYGITLNNYTLLKWGYKENSYWQCTTKTGITTPGSSQSTYKQNICTDKKYSVEDELPVGTIFVCDPGWRYRLEIFPDKDSIYEGKQPEGSAYPFFILTEDAPDGRKYVAWDVSTEPKTDISAIYAQA